MSGETSNGEMVGFWIPLKIVEEINAVFTIDELKKYVQSAIELEHCTIPPYLTALFSLKPGTNDMIAGLIRDIVVQEMLHMTIAANLLIALGGTPAINTAEFVPKYPGKLPMGIGGDSFKVGIQAFSKDLVINTFMVIEKPENPIPTMAEYATIGEFYKAIIDKVSSLSPPFVRPNDQVVGNGFPSDQLFKITNLETAKKAINIIVKQGEGTSDDPDASLGNLAHYYTFGGIHAGRKLIALPGSIPAWGYQGEAIPCDESAKGVYPMIDNPKIASFTDPLVKARVKQFVYYYNSLLYTLHEAFNQMGTGKQNDLIKTALAFMYDLKTVAVGLMQTPSGNNDGKNAGPSFEYIKVQGGIDTIER